VIVASFTKESKSLAYLTSPASAGRTRGVGPLFPYRGLPLRVSDATPYIQSGTQIRPQRPLGQFQLRAGVNDHLVDLQLYFGTPHPSEARMEEAQSQLDGLIVGGESVDRSRPTAQSRPASSAQSKSVTLEVTRFFDTACRCYKARVYGRVSSGKAGEYVVVLEEFCGRGSGRSAVAATTREGGGWEAVIDGVVSPDSGVAVSYRSRWNDVLSDPVSFKGRLTVTGKRQAPGRQLLTVLTSNVNPVNLKGRQVVLQRQVGGGWARVGRARLAPHRTRYYTFTATFTGVRRGWTVRALVPSRSAAPCFTASPSETWIS
jgi:hypothetical protein